MKSDKLKDTRAKLVAWISKVEVLKEQINNLEKIKKIPIISISVFLLKSQLIEFELKQFITTLDLYVNSAVTASMGIRRSIRKPIELNNLTLRKLVGEINFFEGIPLDMLKKDLGKLVDLRDNFTHHLFSQKKDLKQTINDSEKGIEFANVILNSIETLNKNLLSVI